MGEIAGAPGLYPELESYHYRGIPIGQGQGILSTLLGSNPRTRKAALLAILQDQLQRQRREEEAQALYDRQSQLQQGRGDLEAETEAQRQSNRLGLREYATGLAGSLAESQLQQKAQTRGLNPNILNLPITEPPRPTGPAGSTISQEIDPTTGVLTLRNREPAPNLPQVRTLQDLMQLGEALKDIPEGMQRQVYGSLTGIKPSLLSPKLEEQLLGHKIEREQKREEVLDEPLGEKASKYVHKETGERATPDMTRKDVSGRGSNYLALSGTQEKIYEGLNNLKAHADLAESYIDEFPSGGLRTWNNFKMWLRTQANDPQAVALNAQLEAMTPVALSRSLGGSGRGGAILAKMLKEAAFTGGETVDTAKEKLKNMRTLASDLAEANGLPVAPFRGERESTSEERIKVVSPSGKTGTIPASQLEEALKSGYKRAQ